MPASKLEFQLHAIIAGRVQGVGFRYFVLEKAQNLGVAGWVRNLWDGQVEVTAEGSKADLDVFLTALRRGPSSARVTSTKEEWLTPIGEYNGFHIRSTF